MSAERREMSDSCLWYPAVGILLGLLLSLAAVAIFHSTASSAVAAWGYVLLSAWLTRALHIDGLADVADALGSGKSGQEFHAVLKDSRIGAFGCLAIVLAAYGQIAAVDACLRNDAVSALFFAPVFGRCLPMLFTALAPAYPGAGLGAILTDAPAAACRRICLAVAFFFGLLCLGFGKILLVACMACAAMWFLAGAAKRAGGYNGDFFGALILLGECAVLLAGSLRLPG